MRISAVLSVLVGTAGGYALARYTDDLEIFVVAGLAWWLLSALLVSLGARGSSQTSAVVTVFLLIWIGAPLVAVGVTLGLRDRAAEAIDGIFDGGDDDAYSECLADPGLTLEQCELLRSGD